MSDQANSGDIRTKMQSVIGDIGHLAIPKDVAREACLAILNHAGMCINDLAKDWPERPANEVCFECGGTSPYVTSRLVAIQGNVSMDVRLHRGFFLKSEPLPLCGEHLRQAINQLLETSTGAEDVE